MLFTALLFGAYMSRRINVSTEDGSSFATIQHEQIWADLIAMFALIGTVCVKFVAFSRATRNYFDNELAPWLQGHGISVTLPQLDLPALPGKRSEISAQ